MGVGVQERSPSIWMEQQKVSENRCIEEGTRARSLCMGHPCPKVAQFSAKRVALTGDFSNPREWEYPERAASQAWKDTPEKQPLSSLGQNAAAGMAQLGVRRAWERPGLSPEGLALSKGGAPRPLHRLHQGAHPQATWGTSTRTLPQPAQEDPQRFGCLTRPHCGRIPVRAPRVSSRARVQAFAGRASTCSQAAPSAGLERGTHMRTLQAKPTGDCERPARLCSI